MAEKKDQKQGKYKLAQFSFGLQEAQSQNSFSLLTMEGFVACFYFTFPPV